MQQIGNGAVFVSTVEQHFLQLQVPTSRISSTFSHYLSQSWAPEGECNQGWKRRMQRSRTTCTQCQWEVDSSHESQHPGCFLCPCGQAKTSVFIIGPVISKRRAQGVDSRSEWTDDFYEKLQINLKHFPEFQNGPSYLYRQSQRVLVFSLSEGLYEDIC